MPADTTKARDFLFSSDFPLDKVVWIHERSETVNSMNQFITFAHGLPFTPLIRVVWSTNSSFSTTYGVGDGPVGGAGGFIPFDPILGAAWADSSDVTLVASAVSSYTMYIRVYAFIPSNEDVDADFTVDDADNFVLNMDYNYSKLLMEGRTDNLTTLGQSVTIDHNLGYYPQVELWYEQNGNIQVFTRSNPLDYAYYIEFSGKVTPTQLVLRRDNSTVGGQRFHYRIYGDEL